MRRSFDAVVLTMGATEPRELPAPGRDQAGIYRAMDFLGRQNRHSAESMSEQANARIDLANRGAGRSPLPENGRWIELQKSN